MTEVQPTNEALRTPEHLRLEGGAISVETLNGLVSILPVDGNPEKLGKDGATISRAVLIDTDDKWRISSAVATLELEEMRAEKRNSLVGILLAAIGMAATAIAGCGPNPNSSDGDDYSAYKSPLSPEDLEHLGTQLEACFTESGDIRPNIGIFNGEVVVTFIRDNHCYYVKAADIIEALTTECTAQLINLPGIIFPGADLTVFTCAVHADIIYYSRGAEPIYADLVDNAGNLEAQNPQHIPNSPTGSYSIIVEGGIPFLLWRQGGKVIKHNLNDHTEVATIVDADCGVPHMDPDTGVWVGARPGIYGGGVTCRLIQAPTLEALQSSLQFIPGIMMGPGGLEGDSKNPRIVGNVLIFEGREKDPDNPGDLLPSGIYYALVTEYCGDGTCDGTETSVDCPADCDPEPFCGDGSCDVGINEDINNCPVDCAVCGDDICTDPPETDANCAEDCPEEEPDGGVDGEVDGEPDGEVDGEPDGEADGEPDGEVDGEPDGEVDGEPDGEVDGDTDADADGDVGPDADVDPCEFAAGKIRWIDDECLLGCNSPIATVIGACTFEVDLGGDRPVRITLDGEYSIDLLAEAADRLSELVKGKFKVVTNGNDFSTVHGNTETVASGTTYGVEGRLPHHVYIFCEEDKIDVFQDGVKIASLVTGENILVDLEGSTDGGVDGGDGETPGNGGDGCGCGTKPGEGQNKGALPLSAIISIVFGAIVARRKQEELETSARMPGVVLERRVSAAVSEKASKIASVIADKATRAANWLSEH